MADQNAVQLNYDLVPSPQLQSKLQRQFADLERNLKFKSPFSATAREVKDFGSELDRANQRVITLGASFAVLTTSLRTLKSIVTATIEVEKAFTEINAVFQLGSRELDRFSKDLFNAARTTGQSFERAAEAAKEFSRQGLTAQETIKRTTDALMLSRLANLDVAKSVETLTASINGFQKSALTSTEIVNKLATVDARFAVSSADLAEGLARAGAAAADAGVNFDQLVGMITAAQQTTARGGAVIGNSLKTIFTRVERSDTIDAFRSLGIEVEDVSGKTLGAIPLLTNFARAYDTLGDSVKKQAAQMVGGVYQINILKAVLGDLARANGVAAQATDVSKTATDEAIKRNEALNQSLDSMLVKLGSTTKQIGANIGSQSFAGPLKSLMGMALDNPLTKALEDASGKAETAGGKFAEFFMKGIGGSLVFGLGPLVAKAMGGVVMATGRAVTKDFSMLAGISSESQKQAALQADINTLYRQGGTALQQQLAAMSSLTAQADALQRLLNVGSKGGTGQMASVLYQRGVRSSRAPGAAGGYVPMAEEAAAISAGVGGAPMGARPVYLPSFNRGGGQRGIVANTSEWMVPGAAGGSIYNRDMISRFGLPPGAKPVAAGGYVPHAAGGTNPSWSDPDYYKWKPEAVQKAEEMAQRHAAFSAARAANLQSGGSSGDFDRAQRELDKRRDLEEKAAARKERELAKMHAMLDREDALLAKKVLLSATDIKAGEKYLGELQRLYAEARQRGSAKTAVVVGNMKPVIEGIHDPETGMELPEAYEQRMAAFGHRTSQMGAPSQISRASVRLQTRLNKELGVTYPETFFKRQFPDLTLSDLGAASGLRYGGGVGSSVSDRYGAGQIARQAVVGNVVGKGGVNYGQLGDALQASRALDTGQTLQEQFNRTVRELVDSGKGMNTAYNAAIAQIMGETDNRKQINSIIRKSIPANVQYERELRESQALTGFENKMQRASIGRQTVLNAATAKVGAGESWGALSGPQRQAVVSQLRQKAMGDLGFGGMNPAMVLKDATARAQINAAIAPVLAELKGRGQTMPPSDVPVPPSRWQRMRGAVNRQNAGYAAAFGLPFAGANIDEGVGGTGMGMLRGAAGAGLSMAGTGAAFGMMAGPGGALIGGGAGLLLGGAYGAISKMEESFEELARRIQEANAKINGEVNATTEIFQLQEQLKTAKENRLPESKIDDIKQNINRAFSKVSNPEVLRLLRTQMDDPEVQSKVGDEFSKSKRTAIGGLDLAAAVQGALQEGSSTRGLYGYNDGARDRISGAVQPFIANLSPEEQKRLRAMAQNDPSAALRQIGGLAGLGDDQQAKMVDRGSSGFLSGRLGGVMAEQTLILFENSILDALDNLRRKGAKGFADSVEAAIAKTERFTKTLEDLSSEYQVQSRFVQIEADAFQQIGKARQSIGVNDPAVSDRDRIDLQGRFDRQNISAQFSAQRSGSLLSAQAGMFDMINKKGFESPQLRERLQGLTSVDDVNRLKGDINRPGGIPMLDAKGLIKALDDLAENLTVLNTSEKSQMEVSRMTIDLLRRQFDQTRSFSGAVGDDTGLYNRARAAREAAIARGEPSDVIADASSDERLAQTRLLRRFMMRSDEDVDVESMGIDLRRQADAAKRARTAKQGLGRETLVGLGVEDGTGSFSDELNQSGIDLEVAKRLGSDSETIRQLRIKNAALKRQDRYRNSDGTTEGAARLGALEDAERFTSGDPFANGQDITGARMATARERGLQGDSKGSFLGGFRAEIEGAKRDLLDFSEVGSRVAQNLHGSGVDAWSSWVTGAKQGKEAFRDFSISVLSDASRMLSSKAFSAALAAIPGFGGFTPTGATGGEFTGRSFKFAAGGMVPAMLTGGEVYISPRGVKRIGADKLRGINSGRQGYAAGGDVRMVRGGSGVKDDVPANLPPGSFIVKKSVAQRLGPRYFESLAAGRVQHRFLGGFLGMPALYGALLGGGVGYATGGKKGAIGGALLGGIAGGVYGMNSGGVQMDPATGQRAVLSLGEKALLMGGASAGLGLLANGMTKRDKESGPISLAQVPAYRAQLEADQQNLLNGRGAGQSAYLSINPQGGYSLAGVGADVATRRWDAGGGVDLPLSSGGGGSSEPKVTVAITINNNGQTSATASSSNGDGPFGGDFAGKLEKAIRPIVRDELVQQSRSDGFFSQRSRYVNNA